MQFEARLQGPCSEPRVTLHFKAPSTKWRSRKMHLKEQGQYGINVQIQRSNKGRTLWWMQAACPNGAQTSAGSTASPKSLMVK